MTRRTVRLCAVLCIALGSWLTLAGPAQATDLNHAMEAIFPGSDAPGGPLEFVAGNAVDNSGGPSDGHIYAAHYDFSNPPTEKTFVSKFTEDGSYAGVSLDGSNTPQGSFSFHVPGSSSGASDALAVDGSSGLGKGNLYVIDGQHGVIDRFSETGQYLCQITGAATPSASECNGLAGSATPAGVLKPVGIEVNKADGHIFVIDLNKNIYEFSESGAYIRQISDAHITAPGSLALDSTGAIYVVDAPASGPQRVLKFSAAGSYLSMIETNSPYSIAVDQSEDHLYVGRGFGGISEFDASGALLSTFATSTFLLSISANDSNGRINAASFSLLGVPGMYIFGPDAVVPTLSTNAASEVTETTASLSGSADPDGGEVVACRFEYGPTTAYGQTAPCVPAPPYASSTPVTVDLSGLSKSTTYHFRLAAKNAPAGAHPESVWGRSADGIFITEGHPTVDAQSTSGIERTGATLRATINPHGFDSEFKFEYVDDKHFQEGGFANPATKSTSFSELGGGLKVRAVNQAVFNLAIDTTYHYRAVAINSRGTGVGPTQTFKTLPPATVGRQWAYARVFSAHVEAKVNPLGFDTSCHVQFVSDADFSLSGYAEAETQPCVKGLGAGSQDTVAKAVIGGLELDTKYHFRFVTTNDSGVVPGSDETFETFGFDSFSVESLDEEGNPYTQAGGHPYQKIIRYSFNHTLVPDGKNTVGSLNAFLKSLFTEQPAGHSGVRDEATPKCPGYKAEENKCSPESQVGTLTIEYFSSSGGTTTNTKKLYNVVAPDGVASRYATLDPYTASDTKVRTGGDYGTTSVGEDITEEAKSVGLTVVVWGIPADHVPSATRSAILRNPTACTGPLTARVRADTWQAPGHFAEATAQMPAITGCDKLEFHPSIEWKPSSTAAGSPTGLHVDIHQPQNDGPDDIAFGDLKDVVINPAKGLIFNPAGAGGLVGCSSAQIGLHEETPARCPDAAKIGTVEINTPLVDHPLLGGIYMATPHDNKFDSMFAIYLAIHDPRSGVVVKLAGRVDADAGDGQLSANFFENPQLPVEDFKLRFFDGPRAVVRTPSTCGTFVTTSSLTPWSAPQSGPPVHPTDSYEITSGPNGGKCVASEAELPAKLDFRAGTVAPKAGAYSPFVIRLHREDGTQQIADLAVTPPPGLLGRLAGLSRCSPEAIAAAERRTGRAERAAPSCPAGSQVGTVVVAAGAGPLPYYVNGKVYVGGPYRGAPLSLAVVVPAVAGPFDLGTVVVRTPLRVDLESGQVKVDSEPLPTILEGVSLDVRTIEVRLDRPGFIVNPTNCSATATDGRVTSVTGTAVALSHPFRVGQCGKLRFAPKVKLRLLGKTRRRSHPGMRAVLTMPEGGANIAGASVSMPPTLFLDNSNIRDICTRDQFLRSACPKDSIYGYAKAWSPLLDRPLAGPVYMRSSTGGLPDLIADLNGEFRVAVGGQINAKHGGIGADIRGLPDVPVKRFVMTMRGGGKGLLQNSVDVCANPKRGLIRLTAQNGKIATLRPALRAKCPKAAANRKRQR